MKRWRLLLTVAAAMAALPVSAANSNFLADAPIAKFTEQDMQMFTHTLDDLLSNAADGTLRKWSNPATKASGDIKVIKSFEQGSLKCRRVRIRNSAKGVSAAGQYDLCRSPAGEWLAAP